MCANGNRLMAWSYLVLTKVQMLCTDEIAELWLLGDEYSINPP